MPITVAVEGGPMVSGYLEQIRSRWAVMDVHNRSTRHRRMPIDYRRSTVDGCGSSAVRRRLRPVRAKKMVHHGIPG
jgi:hypothetical protein